MPIHVCVTSPSSLCQTMYLNTCMCHIAILALPDDICQYMYVSHRHPRWARRYMPIHVCVTSPSSLSQTIYANTCMCHIAIHAEPDDICQYMYVSHRHPRSARRCTSIHVCVTSPSSLCQTIYANTCMCHIAILAEPDDICQYMYVSHRHPRWARRYMPIHVCVTSPSSLCQTIYANTCMCHIAIVAEPDDICQYMYVSHRHPRSARRCTSIHVCVTSPSSLCQTIYANTCMCHIAILAEPDDICQYMYVSHRHPRWARRYMPIHVCVTSPSSLSQTMYPNTCMCHIATHALPDVVQQCVHVSHRHPRWAGQCMPIHICVTSPSSLCQTLCGNACMCPIAILAEPDDVCQYMYVSHCYPRWAGRCTPIHVGVTSPASLSRTMYANTCMCHIAILALSDVVRQCVYVSHRHPRWAGRCMSIHVCVTLLSSLSRTMYPNTCMCHIAILAEPDDVCQYMYVSHCYPRWAGRCTPIHACVTSQSSLSRTMYANTCMCHIAILALPDVLRHCMPVSHRHPRWAGRCMPLCACHMVSSSDHHTEQSG